MTDVATLGLAVDSSQVDKGKISLDQLSNAAKRAQVAAGGVSSSTKNAGQAAVSLSASAGRAAASLNSEAAAAQKAASAMQVHSKAMNDNVVRVNRMGGSMSGLAAQFQDIGVTAAMGMNPMIIGLQQGTQIAGQMEAAMQGGSSAVGVLGTAFRSLFQPLTFVSIALTVLAAGVFQLVDWVSLGQSALTGLADVLQTVAPYATMAAAGLTLLYAPAILGGLKALTLGILGAARAAGAAAIAFAAANPAVAFVLGITAAVAAANIFRDELAKIFGRDIVDDAKTAVNWVIGAFVGGYEAIKATWSDLPAVMGDLSFQAGEAFLGGVNAMLNAAIDAIKRFYLTVLNPVAGVAKAVGFDTLSKWTGGNLLDGFNANASMGGNQWAGAASQAAADASAAMRGAMNVDYVGKGYEIIAKGASAAADKLRNLAGGLGETEKATKRAKTEAEKLAEKYNDILLDAESFISTQMVEKDALLLSSEAANALRYEQELLNKAMQAGITIDAAKAAEIKSYAAAMAGAEAETSRFREALNFTKDLFKGFVSDLRSGLEQGKGFWKSFGDAALNVLDKVIDKLLDNFIDAIFQVNKAGSGLGNIFTSLFGGLFGGGGGSGMSFPAAPVGLFHSGGVVGQSTAMRMADPRMFLNAPRYHGGGIAGDEVPAILRRGEIISRDWNHLRQQAGNGNSGGELVIRIVGEEGKTFNARVQQISGRVAGVVVQAASGSIAEQGAAKAQTDARTGGWDGTMSRFGATARPKVR